MAKGKGGRMMEISGTVRSINRPENRKKGALDDHNLFYQLNSNLGILVFLHLLTKLSESHRLAPTGLTKAI
jgi:hypothetical protein